MANKHSSIILTHTLLTILLLQLIRTVDSSSWNPSYSNRAENALARFNSRFSKAIAEELDNSTVAMDNNTVEENMVPSSTTSDDVTYYPSRKEKPSGKVEEVSLKDAWVFLSLWVAIHGPTVFSIAVLGLR